MSLRLPTIASRPIRILRSYVPHDLAGLLLLIADAVGSGRYRCTIHGAQQRIARRIYRNGIESAISNGRIIEYYPSQR